jgi:hypothetical protein
MGRDDRIAFPPLRDIPEQDDRILHHRAPQLPTSSRSIRASLAVAGSRHEPSGRTDLDSPEYREAAEMQSDSCAP